MNKEQILNALKELRNQIPIKLDKYNHEIVEDIARQLIREEEKLKNPSLVVNSFELEEINKTIDRIERNLKLARLNYRAIVNQISTTADNLNSAKSDLRLSENNKKIEIEKSKIYDDEAAIKECESKIKNIEDEIAEEQSVVERYSEEFEEIKKQKAPALEEINYLKEEYHSKLRDRASLIIEIEEKKVSLAKGNVESLKSQLGVVSTGLVSELDDLILNYENGNIDNAIVNYYVNRIKNVVESNKELNIFENYETDVITDQLEGVNDEIKEIENRIKMNQYRTRYNANLKSKKDELKKLERYLKRQEDRYNKNIEKLSGQLTDNEKSYYAEIVDGIMKRMDVRRDNIAELKAEINNIESDYEAEIEKYKKEDMKKLKEAKKYRKNMEYMKSIHEVSMLDKLDVLITATGGKLENDSIKTEEPVKNDNLADEEVKSEIEEELPIIKDEDKKIDKPKFILDEEKAPVIEPNNEEKGLVPVETKEEFPPLGPTEVVGYEEPKEAVKKPNKLKKILLIAATALSLIAVGISSMIKKGKDNVVVPPASTPSITDEMVEEEKPTITPELPTETPAPEDEKDNNDKPSKDKDDNKPSKDDDKPSKPTEKPDEEVEQTPEPIVAKPGDQIVDVIKDDDGNIIGERVTTIGDDGQVIVDETGDVEKLEDQEIIVDTDDVEIVDEEEELQQDNPQIAEDEALLDQFQEDLENGNIEDSIIWEDTLIDGTTGEEVSEDVPSSPDEVNIDNYSVKAEDTLDLNSPFGMSQEELDALINGILNGEDQSMTL